MTVLGWGSMPWGAGPWGDGGEDALRLLDALAVRENVVRLTFNLAPFYTGLQTLNDAANPARYVFIPQDAPEAISGGAARAVLPVRVDRPAISGAGGRILDVTLDRPLSPWASRYRVAVNLLLAIDGTPLDPAAASRIFDGLYRQLRPADPSAPTPSRDVANPWTYQAQLGAGAVLAGEPQVLGVFPLDASGDYAQDQGLQQLKKRVFRRLNTRKNAFPSLPGYGVGVPSYGKRLASEAIRQQIAADAQAQLSTEPDVVAAAVTSFTDPKQPSVTIFRVKVRMAGSAGEATFDFPYTHG